MSLAISNASAVLKEFYLPGTREQINNKTLLLQEIEKGPEDVEGLEAVLSLHTRRSSGVGARAELGDLPAADRQRYAKQRVPLKNNYGRIQISGPVIKAMGSDRGSFERAVDSEMKGITKDLRRDVNRQAWGTGDSVIATTGATTASTTLVLDAATSETKMRQLEQGMKVDIGTLAAPTSRTTANEIVSVNIAAKTVLLTNAVTTAAGEFVFRSGAALAGSVSNEITGVQKIVSDTGTLHGVDPAVEQVWKSTVKANGGVNRALSEDLMAEVVHNIDINSGESPNLGICGHAVSRKYANLLTSLKRFPQTVNLKGGYAGLDFTAGGATIPIVVERDAPGNQMFFLSTDSLKQHQSSEWEWMDDDGAILSRVAGKDAYEATLYKYHELTTDARNRHGVLKDITE